MSMSNQQTTGLAPLGLAIIVILAGIAASLSPLGLGAAIVGLLIGAAGAARLR
jgi:hypothetical protein